MSIPVDVGDLARALEGYAVGYLLTSSAEGRVKAVTVEPTLEGSTLRIAGPGGGTLRNLATNPAVTVLFPPLEQRGFTLLVDGTAQVRGDDVEVTPQSAVLHRPAMHADGPPPPVALGEPTACGNDCAPIG
jgi:hypothetical protein